MRKGIFVGVAALLAATVMAQGAITPIFSDNFESYATNADFLAVWNGDPLANTSLDVGYGKGGGNAALIGKNCAVKTLSPLSVSDATPLVLEFDMWDYATGTADRTTVGLRNGANPLFEFGEYNSMDPNTATTGDTLIQGYGFRTVGMGGPTQASPNSQGWIAMVPNAQKLTSTGADGWHHYKAVIGETSLTASITLGNGTVYTKTVSLTGMVGDTIVQLRIGTPSNVGSTGISDVDNVQLYTTPEPASMLLLGLGGLLLRRRRA